jgi:hypothetical protein
VAKHKWQKLPDGEVNGSAMSEGFHHGPICVECGHYFCVHCQSEEWDSECPGRAGFKVRLLKSSVFEGKILGVRWYRKALQFWFVFWAVSFDFSGLFPYCAEVEED